ncbi:MAG: serine/threonine-protein kinase, partial [Myxococcales bacterium]|nr:serine/threonine-protein kinase [Myxococcales bacterium]
MRSPHIVRAPLPVARPSAGPDSVGPYVIERPLGAGGMGRVYQARHSLTEAPVALKILDGQVDELATTRFLREVRAASRIGHPDVVQVLDAGQTDRGELFIVMELLEGETLCDLVEEANALDAGLRPLLRALPALAAAHRAGFVHRDLKPENLFVLSDGSVKLLDFGIALDLNPGTMRTGNVLGTPHYMSPEQVRHPSLVAPASDVWAVGVMLYEILAGVLPFDGETASGVVVTLCTDAHVPLNKRRPKLDPGLVAIVERCLCKDPAERYSDAEALLAVLSPWMHGAPTEPTAGEGLEAGRDSLEGRPTQEFRRRRWPVRRAAWVAASVTVVAVAWPVHSAVVEREVALPAQHVSGNLPLP